MSYFYQKSISKPTSCTRCHSGYNDFKLVRGLEQNYYKDICVLCELGVEVEVVEQIMCVICLEDIDDNIYRTSCDHEFHNNCIQQWNSVNDSCPVCRNELNFENR